MNLFPMIMVKLLFTCSTSNEIYGLQSLHPAADYHAAARAIGGCAIYVRYCYAKVDF